MHNYKQLATVLAVLMLTACAATKEGNVPEDTGFLRAPDLLKPGKPGQAGQPGQPGVGRPGKPAPRGTAPGKSGPHKPSLRKSGPRKSGPRG